MTSNAPIEDADDGEGVVRRTTVSALDVLQRQHRELLFDGASDRALAFRPLREGFQDRRGVVNWYQAAVVRTFGHVPEVFAPSELERDEALLDALVSSSPRARFQRMQLLEQALLPACQQAYRHLRTQARERVSDGNTDREKTYQGIEPERQRHVAMRPAFSRLDATQAGALAELWGGFRNRDGLVEWLHSLRPTGRFDPDLPRQVTADPAAMQYLTDQQDPDAAAYRERLAIGVLLPGFARRARDLQGGELPRSRGDPDLWNEGVAEEANNA